MTHFCRLCGLPLTPISEVHDNVTYSWFYCADHPQTDQDARSVPLKVEGV